MQVDYCLFSIEVHDGKTLKFGNTINTKNDLWF